VLGKKLALDLGTTRFRLHVRGEGVAITEPATVAVDAAGRVVAAGAAVADLGDAVSVRTPLRHGAVADPLAARAAVVHLVTRAVGRQRIFRPDVAVAVPAHLRGDDRLLLLDAGAQAGARLVHLVDVPLAGALGAGLPVSSTTAHLVVDIGGDTAEIAVLAAESTISCRTVPLGGRVATAAVARAVEEKLGAVLDEAAAEAVKREIGSPLPVLEERTLRVRGVGGDPRADLLVSSSDVLAPLQDYGHTLAVAIAEVLDDTPRRLRDDLEVTGLVLTGGGARLWGLDRLLSGVLRLRARVAASPDTCVVRGAAAAMESLEVVRRNVLYVR
jgi:rod shape-determining protein MreB